MSENRFFSKSNIYSSIWAFIIGIIAFFVGLAWKNLAGPDEVVVLNNENIKDTNITIIRFQPDEKYFDDLSKLTSQNLQKQYSKSNYKDKYNDIDSLALDIVKEYQLKYDSLRLSLNRTNDLQKPIVNYELVSIPSENRNVVQLKRPIFKMPAIVEGYSEAQINSFASISINSTVFKQNDEIVININFFDESTIRKISPLFVNLVKPGSDNNVYHIWGDQYEIVDRKSILKLSSDFKPGNYIFNVGFYLLDEINTKFPAYYSKKYKIEIK